MRLYCQRPVKMTNLHIQDNAARVEATAATASLLKSPLWVFT